MGQLWVTCQRLCDAAWLISRYAVFVQGCDAWGIFRAKEMGLHSGYSGGDDDGI